MILSTSIFVTSLASSLINIHTVPVLAQPQEWPAAPYINGTAACLIEASTGTVLYGKSAQQKMYPASITKILTALVTLENASLDENVVFSEEAVYSLEAGDANMGMYVDEIMTIEECLYGLMLQSANEVATALAEHCGGSVEGFAEMMNEAAKKAGATNSNFMNANGLHNENHYITAYDMAMITRAAISNPVFVSISGSKEYTVGKTNKKAAQTIYNRHKMLFANSGYYYEGILGGKTGYTDQSGTTLVTYAQRDGMTLICVVLDSNGVNVYLDTATLFDYGFDNFKLANVSENDTRFTTEDSNYSTILKPVYGESSDIELYIDKNSSIVLPKDASFTDVTSSVSTVVPENTDSSDSETVVGTISYSYGDTNIGTANIVYDDITESVQVAAPITESKPGADSEDSFDISKYINFDAIKFFLIVVGIVVVIIFIIRYINKKKRELNERRARQRRRNSQRYSSGRYGGYSSRNGNAHRENYPPRRSSSQSNRRRNNYYDRERISNRDSNREYSSHTRQGYGNTNRTTRSSHRDRNY